MAVHLQSAVKPVVCALLLSALAAVGPAVAAPAGTIRNADNNVVEVTMNYHIRVAGKTDSVRLVTLVPRDIEHKQQIVNITYSVPPARFFESGGNRYAEYVFTNLSQDVDIRVNADVALQRFDLSSAADMRGREIAPEEYLKNEPYIEKDDPQIAAIARSIGGRDEIETIRNIYQYVTSTLSYRGYVREDVGASRVLFERKYGDCSDFSDALVAIARAKNIPARTVDGFLTEYSDNNPRHTWVEIYTSRYGWVPFDPLLGNLRQVSFDRLTPKYIYLSDTRNDPALNYYHFFTCNFTGGAVNVTDNYSIRQKKDGLILTQG